MWAVCRWESQTSGGDESFSCILKSLAARPLLPQIFTKVFGKIAICFATGIHYHATQAEGRKEEVYGGL